MREMEALASGSQCKNYLYHASINPPANENLSPDQWAQAVELLEKNLGLEGHQRIIVEHVKEGRAHQHIIWNRVDPDTMTAVRMSHNYRAHELTARELEREFGLDRVQGAHVERDGPRPERQPKQWEVDRGRRTGIDPRHVKAEVSALWNDARDGEDFKALLESRGYILAQGDRRDFVIIDRNGDPHSVSRRASVKAAEVREILSKIDRDRLPTVEEAREMQEKARDGHMAAILYDRADMASQQRDAVRDIKEHEKHREKAPEVSVPVRPADPMRDFEERMRLRTEREEQQRQTAEQHRTAQDEERTKQEGSRRSDERKAEDQHGVERRRGKEQTDAMRQQEAKRPCENSLKGISAKATMKTTLKDSAARGKGNDESRPPSPRRTANPTGTTSTTAKAAHAS